MTLRQLYIRLRYVINDFKAAVYSSKVCDKASSSSVDDFKAAVYSSKVCGTVCRLIDACVTPVWLARASQVYNQYYCI